VRFCIFLARFAPKHAGLVQKSTQICPKSRVQILGMATVDPTVTTIDAPSADLVAEPAWIALKAAATALQGLQIKNGSIPQDASDASESKSATATPAHTAAATHVATICSSIEQLAPHFPHDASYLSAVIADFGRWVDGGFGEPDFLASILEFAPAAHRVAGVRHLVVFPMYTQNKAAPIGLLRQCSVEVLWPEFIAELEAGEYSNKMLVPLRFLDFTAGYDTNSAVLFPESVAMSSVPSFTWGALFQDREAARLPQGDSGRRRDHWSHHAQGCRGTPRQPSSDRRDLHHVGSHSRPHSHEWRSAV